ncbi:MAG: hypothetical protein II821_10530 [Treponema sp.]|nr:hypothetical protein [Treponema sp.]
MKFARSCLAKILTLVCSFLGIPAFFSCDDEGNSILVRKEELEVPAAYGMPVGFAMISGTVSGDVDGDGAVEPLKNIKITSDRENIEMPAGGYVTAEDGMFRIDVFDTGEYTFTFEDGDGSENGSFKSQTKTVLNSGSGDINLDVTLEKSE